MRIHKHFFEVKDRIDRLPHLGTPGTWNWYGINLPDFGLTEAITGSWGNPNKSITNNPLVSTIGTNTPQGSYFSPQSSVRTGSVQGVTPAVNNNGGNNGGGGGGGGGDTKLDQYLKMQAEGSLNPAQKTELEQMLAEARNSKEAQDARTRQGIESGFGEYERRLGELEGQYGQEAEQERQRALQGYDTIFGGLKEQKAANLAKLGTSRQQVKARGEQSLEDLKRNLQDVVRSMSFQLGALGAGDTSAAQVMMPYAYTKLAGVQGGQIARQVNDQQFEIDKQEKDTESQFSQLWNQTELEKQNAVDDITRYYGEKIAAVRSYKTNAPLEKMNALNALEMQLLNQAQNKLATLESEVRQKQNSLEQWARERMAQLNNMKLQLQNSANFSPRDILWSELQAANAAPSARENAYSPAQLLAMARRRQQEYFG